MTINAEEIKRQLDIVNKNFHDYKETAEEINKKAEKGDINLTQYKEEVTNVVKDLQENYTSLKSAFDRIETAKNVDGELEKSVEMFNKISKNYGNEKPITVDQAKDMKDAYDTYIRRGERALSDAQYKLLNIAIDPQGGYLTAPQYSPELVKKEFEERGILRIVSSLTTNSGEYIEGVDWNDYEDAAYYNDLGTIADATTDTDFGQVRYYAKEQLFPKKFSRSLIEDSYINIETYVLDQMRLGAIRQTAGYMVSGNGVDKPRGLLTYENGTTFGKIEQVTSKVNDKISWDDVMNILPKALKGNYTPNAKYLMNDNTFYDLLVDVTGMGKYQIGNQINFFSGQGLSLAILGKEVVFDAGMPVVANAAKAIVFGDFSRAYLLTNRIGFSIIRNETNAKYIELTLRRRNDGKVRNFEALKILVIQ